MCLSTVIYNDIQNVLFFIFEKASFIFIVELTKISVYLTAMRDFIDDLIRVIINGRG